MHRVLYCLLAATVFVSGSAHAQPKRAQYPKTVLDISAVTQAPVMDWRWVLHEKAERLDVRCECAPAGGSMLARNSVKVEIVGPHGKRSGRTGKYESAKRSVVRYTETFFSILHPGTYVLRLSIRGACEGRVTRVSVVALPTE